MKESINSSLDMKPGPKGVRVSISHDLLEFISKTSQEILTAWNEADTKEEFWELLDGLEFTEKNDSETVKYGIRKYKGFAIRDQEFRITVINKSNALSIDIRTWWL